MGIIKRNQLQESGILMIEKSSVIPLRKKVPPPPPGSPMIELDLQTHDLEKAKSEAEKIIEQAYADADRIKEESKEEGRAEGKEEANEKVREALGVLNEAVKERKKIVKDAEGEILRLSLRVAEKIIRSEVSLHRDVSLNIVTEAIGKISDREQIIIRVNHDDAEYLKSYKDRLAGLLDGVKSFSIIEDANVEAGGCIIETNLGFIDARISTKLQSIDEALKKISTEENE